MQSNINNVVAVAAGSQHTVVVKSDETVWAWGDNHSIIGNGTNANSNVPVQSNISSVVTITAGELHTIALKSDGTVWAWGYNDYGQLGNGMNASSNVPVQAD